MGPGFQVLPFPIPSEGKERKSFLSDFCFASSRDMNKKGITAKHSFECQDTVGGKMPFQCDCSCVTTDSLILHSDEKSYDACVFVRLMQDKQHTGTTILARNHALTKIVGQL